MLLLEIILFQRMQNNSNFRNVLKFPDFSHSFQIFLTKDKIPLLFPDLEKNPFFLDSGNCGKSLCAMCTKRQMVVKIFFSIGIQIFDIKTNNKCKMKLELKLLTSDVVKQQISKTIVKSDIQR